MIGSVIAGRYEILELLGQGGMGAVYKASEKGRRKPIAIKMLHKELLADPKALKRFEQEGLAIRRLNHPHILAIYDIGRNEQGLPFFATELLEGASLEAVLTELRRLPIGVAIPIFSQVCAGLAHAHKQGVIHRDLKPSNIMLICNEGDSTFVKIVDFGIAKLQFLEDKQISDTTRGEKIMGSPLYMSPEQSRGENLDARSDIYSFGCVMYKAITGVPPFHGKNVAEVLHKQTNEMPASFQICCPNLDISRKLESIIFRAMAKDKNDRYQSMSDLRRDLLVLGKKYANDPEAQWTSSEADLAYKMTTTGGGALSDSNQNPLDELDRGDLPEQKPFEDTSQMAED